MARRLHCHGCGASFPHRPGADLYCTPECRRLHEQQRKDAETALTQQGFAKVPETPNLWQKAGVHLSIEQVNREGMDQALVRHREAVAARRGN